MYGGVFHRIAAEEDQYRDEGAEFLPLFGTSTTAYEEVRYPYMYMSMYYMSVCMYGFRLEFVGDISYCTSSSGAHVLRLLAELLHRQILCLGRHSRPQTGTCTGTRIHVIESEGCILLFKLSVRNLLVSLLVSGSQQTCSEVDGEGE